jgi:hypothetical protein
MAADPRKRSHSQVRVPQDSRPHFTVSDSRLPQPGGPGSRLYIPQEQGGPIIPPGTGFPFRILPRLHTGMEVPFLASFHILVLKGSGVVKYNPAESCSDCLYPRYPIVTRLC